MKFTAFCALFSLCLIFAPAQAKAGNPDPNNEFMKEYGRYRSYTGNKPTHRAITLTTKDYRQSLSHQWRDHSSSLQRDAAIRRTNRIKQKAKTQPFTVRERYRLRRTYRIRSMREE